MRQARVAMLKPPATIAPLAPPSRESAFARVWEPLREDPAKPIAYLMSSIVCAPASHPFWPWKICTVVTLADVEGFPPAIRLHPSMTHELVMIPIAPGADLSTIPEVRGSLPFLLPPDVQHQFAGTDDDARALQAFAIRAVLDGMLTPDSDYRRYWAQELYERTRGVTINAEHAVTDNRERLH